MKSEKSLILTRNGLTPGISPFCCAPARLICNIYPLSSAHSICPASFHRSLSLLFTFHHSQTLAWLCLSFTMCSAATSINTLTLPLSSWGTLTKPTSGRSYRTFTNMYPVQLEDQIHCIIATLSLKMPTMPAYYQLLANQTMPPKACSGTRTADPPPLQPLQQCWQQSYVYFPNTTSGYGKEGKGYIWKGQQIYTVIQAVHSLLYIVAKCNFFSVVTCKDIIKYLQIFYLWGVYSLLWETVNITFINDVTKNYIL